MQIISGKFINEATLEEYQPEKKLFVSSKQAFLLAESMEGAFFPKQIDKLTCYSKPPKEYGSFLILFTIHLVFQRLRFSMRDIKLINALVN